MIAVLAYGSGNIKAITNIYKQLNIDCCVATSVDELRHATRLILPGVGAFDHSMKLLSQSGMLDEVNRLVLQEQLPVLGVCVGMQMMAEASEEGTARGLGWIPGVVKKLDVDALRHKPKLPHMGWNSIVPKLTDNILRDVEVAQGFYFLHSYYFCCRNTEHVLATTRYGHEFPCAVSRNRMYGFQFHPEKSHRNGINLFRNFAEI